MKKKILGIIFIISLIIGIVFFINNAKKYNYTIEQIGEEKYLLLMQNERYGVIDNKGNIIIDPKYDIVEIPNPSKAVFICKNNYDVETKSYNIEVYNESKKRLLYQYFAVDAIRLNGIDNNGYYEKSVLRYKSNDKYGLIDFNGKKITKPIYDSIESFEYKEGLLLVKKDGKYGIININGATVLKENYDEILCDAFYNEDSKYDLAGYIVGNKTSKGMRYGYINYRGKQVLKNEYNEIYRIIENKDYNKIYLVAFKDGRAGLFENNKKIIDNVYEDITYNASSNLLVVQRNSKQGVYTLNGNELVHANYENIFFAGECIRAQKGKDYDIYSLEGKKEDNKDYISKQDVNNGKYKIVITPGYEYKLLKGSDVISNNYSYMQYLFKDYLYASIDYKNGIIDESGKVLVDFKYNIVQKVGDFNIVQLIDDEGNSVLLNENLEEIIRGEDLNLFVEEDYLKVQSKSDIKYFDKNGKEISNEDIYKNNSLIAFSDNDKWGFKDKDGNIVVEPVYDIVTEFNQFGFAGVKKDDLWGVIDEQGKIVVSPSYTITVTGNPSFAGEYYKVNLGYGIPYYFK